MTILTRSLAQLSFATCICFSSAFASASHAQETDHSSLGSKPEREQTSSMTQKRMEDLVVTLSGGATGEPGSIQFTYDEVPMALFSVPELNRMRIVAVVIEADKMSQENLYAMMISNFHLALDARYALGGGVVYSTYIHPLRELTEEQIESGLRQVANLVKTFGTQYTSGELDFGVQAQGEEI